MWESVQQKAFEEIKRALTNAAGLGLPDMTKPFFLCVCIGWYCSGFLTRLLGSWHHPVPYLSKQLDSLAQGRPRPPPRPTGTGSHGPPGI